jgi:hypothetical protein
MVISYAGPLLFRRKSAQDWLTDPPTLTVAALSARLAQSSADSVSGLSAICRALRTGPKIGCCTAAGQAR